MKFFGYYLSDHDIFTVSRCPPLGSDVCNTVSLYGSKIIRLKKGHANEIFNPHLSCTDQWKYFRFCDFCCFNKLCTLLSYHNAFINFSNYCNQHIKNYCVCDKNCEYDIEPDHSLELIVRNIVVW